MKKLAAAPALFCLALQAFALDEAVSPPVGGMTISVPSGQTRSFSLPLIHETAGTGVVAGAISGVGSNFITVTGAGWTPGAYSNVENPYYLRFLSGASAGRVVMVSTSGSQQNTNEQIYVATDGLNLTETGGPVAGDRFELVLADTLSSFFGSTLQGGASASAADNVQVWSGSAWFIFYFNTDRQRWERNVDTAASPSRDDFVLRPDRGFMIVRRAATALDMSFVGRVPSVGPRHFHSRAGVTFLSTGTPVNTTLASLALQDRAFGWTAGSSAASIDYVQVWSGSAWFTFYRNSTSGVWQREGDPADRSTFAIPAGRPIMVRRSQAATISADSLVSLPLPYTL